MKEIKIESIFLWEFIDQEANRIELQRESWKESDGPALVIFGERFLLNRLIDWLRYYEEEVNENKDSREEHENSNSKETK
jgi:hypothetical protein